MNVTTLNLVDDFESIVCFLAEVDDGFVPPLSSRGPIRDFVLRILEPNGFAMGIRNQSRIEGLAGIEWHDQLLGASAFRVVVVSDELKSTPIAARLARDTMSKWKESGMHQIWGRTWNENHESIKLMEWLGFRHSHTAYDARGEGVHEEYFKWEIDQEKVKGSPTDLRN